MPAMNNLTEEYASLPSRYGRDDLIQSVKLFENNSAVRAICVAASQRDD